MSNEAPLYQQARQEYQRHTHFREIIPTVIERRNSVTEELNVQAEELYTSLFQGVNNDFPDSVNLETSNQIDRIENQITSATDSLRRIQNSIPVLDGRIRQAKSAIIADLKDTARVDPSNLGFWENYYGVNLQDERDKIRRTYPSITARESGIVEKLDESVEQVVENFPEKPTLETIAQRFNLKIKKITELHFKKIISVVASRGEFVMGKRDTLLTIYFKDRDLSNFDLSSAENRALRLLAEVLIADFEASKQFEDRIGNKSRAGKS